MTLPTGSLSMSQIATELNLPLAGLSLQHGWVRALAQVTGAANSFNNLRGKTGRYDGFPGTGSLASVVWPANTPWFGGTIAELDSFQGSNPIVSLTFNAAPNWSGNIYVVNNSTGVAVTLPKTNATTWSVVASINNLVRNGANDSYTILPSS